MWHEWERKKIKYEGKEETLKNCA